MDQISKVKIGQSIMRGGLEKCDDSIVSKVCSKDVNDSKKSISNASCKAPEKLLQDQEPIPDTLAGKENCNESHLEVDNFPHCEKVVENKLKSIEKHSCVGDNMDKSSVGQLSILGNEGDSKSIGECAESMCVGMKSDQEFQRKSSSTFHNSYLPEDLQQDSENISQSVPTSVESELRDTEKHVLGRDIGSGDKNKKSDGSLSVFTEKDFKNCNEVDQVSYSDKVSNSQSLIDVASETVHEESENSICVKKGAHLNDRTCKENLQVGSVSSNNPEYLKVPLSTKENCVDRYDKLDRVSETNSEHLDSVSICDDSVTYVEEFIPPNTAKSKDVVESEYEEQSVRKEKHQIVSVKEVSRSPSPSLKSTEEVIIVDENSSSNYELGTDSAINPPRTVEKNNTLILNNICSDTAERDPLTTVIEDDLQTNTLLKHAFEANSSGNLCDDNKEEMLPNADDESFRKDSQLVLNKEGDALLPEEIVNVQNTSNTQSCKFDENYKVNEKVERVAGKIEKIIGGSDRNVGMQSDDELKSNIGGELRINEEMDKSYSENSCDVQESMEFVHCDSDKDENSQHSQDGTIKENSDDDAIDSTREVTSEQDDNIASEEESSDEVDVVNSSNIYKTVGVTEGQENVDLSEICETVLEESNTRSDEINFEKDEIIEVEVIESDANRLKRKETVAKNIEDMTSKSSIGSQISKSYKASHNCGQKDRDEMYVIPGSASQSLLGKDDLTKGKRISKSNEGNEGMVSEKSEDGSEIKKTTPRPQRQAAKRAESQIKEIAADEENIVEHEERAESMHMCDHCFKFRRWVTSFKCQENGSERTKYFCTQDCAGNFKKNVKSRFQSAVGKNLSSQSSQQNSRVQFTRKCSQCAKVLSGDEKNLSWETMDFCYEECLRRFQEVLGSQCANCKGTVASASLGKYCVRFGSDVKQFCHSGCLEEFKKGIKVCSYCQKDISNGAEGFLAPVGDAGQFKDFCTQSCMEKYGELSNSKTPRAQVHECAVCNNEKVIAVEVLHKDSVIKFCSEPCFAAFKFVNGIIPEPCYMCNKYFDKKDSGDFSAYVENSVHIFCSKTCMNVYILANRKIVPCNWCKVKKYNFDMIKRVFNSGQVLLVCSLNCLLSYQCGFTVTSRRIKCDTCSNFSVPHYKLGMSDNTVRNFCSHTCTSRYQEKFTKKATSESVPYPTGDPKRMVQSHRSQTMKQNESPNGDPKRMVQSHRSQTMKQNESPNETTQSTKTPAAFPVISAVQSLAGDKSQAQKRNSVPLLQKDTSEPPADALKVNSITSEPPADALKVNSITSEPPAAALKQSNNAARNMLSGSKVVRQVIVRPPPPKQMRNKTITCRPSSLTKGTHCRPVMCTKETQTEESANVRDNQKNPILIPVPVPIYVPAPMCMYTTLFPVPVPFPLPVPVPVFIPTTRNSAKGIMKEIKRIQEKIPSDPFEAELLMMAEIVAGEKKEEKNESDSDVDDNADGASGTGSGNQDESYSPDAVDSSNTFGDDMLQMALKMASELDEPTDLEVALTSNPITSQSNVDRTNSADSEDDPEPIHATSETLAQRGKRRLIQSQRNSASSTSTAKRRRIANVPDAPLIQNDGPPQLVIKQEKLDANMCLKYTLGVNAWRRWVLTKNSELEKAATSNRKLKLFKPEILQQTADELNYSLCLFVKEVRKPDGQEYAPDTIYYLCLGIQQYLFQNGRIDNIFTDSYYEKFTECLDEVAKRFSSLHNDSSYIVTRVEEEHLWESKQLGAHSPHVLLSTLMFFNTKYFNLITVEEHMQLSFSHIMKHWKRNPTSAANKTNSRNVLLRFYPPQGALEANPRKKKVYEQLENRANPLRCPVKLYEFFMSKCPESVKTRNDVFYLLPERSCVPDSPVWYSTMALGKEPLMKMLHRVKMVKEINQALLKS